MAPRSKYLEEFRRQAAGPDLNSGRSVRDVARELGVNHETLRNWVDQQRQKREIGKPTGLLRDGCAELLRGAAQ